MCLENAFIRSCSHTFNYSVFLLPLTPALSHPLGEEKEIINPSPLAGVRVRGE
jgi:hypothetical protein